MIRLYCKEEEAMFAFIPKTPGDGTGSKEHPTYMREIAHGTTLSTRERNGYNDSDFYALYWDMESGRAIEIEYGTTRFPTYHSGATIDATPEIIALYKDSLRLAREKQVEAGKRVMASLPENGRRVRVFKGRKVAIGTEGVVFWHGCDKYKTYYRNGYNRPDEFFRLGILTDAGERLFLAGTNCKVIGATMEQDAAKMAVTVAKMTGLGFNTEKL